MFDPEDKKRASPGRSLLYLTPRETALPRGGAAKGMAEPRKRAPREGRADQATARKPQVSGDNRGADRPAPSDANVAPSALVTRSADQPLIDLQTIVRSVMGLRSLIIGTTILGAIGGVALAIATPNSYVAETKLYVDPREVRLTDSDLSKQSLATEALLALVDSQLEVLRSRTVLEKVAADLGLDRDTEFGVKSMPATGIAGSIDAVKGILSPPESPPPSTAGVNPRTLEKLSRAVTVSRDPKTFIVTVYVKSRDPDKAALIANRLVSTFFTEEQSAQSGFFQRTTAALDGRLSELRQELDTAENAVETYKAKYDIVNASGQLISDQQLLSLNNQVAAVRTRIADARAKVDVASRTQLDDVLTGAFPEEVSSVAMQELRAQFSQARAQLGSLDASLGPRHPQRLAASQALEAARAEIGNELRRIAASSKTELQRALRTEQDLVQQLAVSKAQQVNASSTFIQLRELERKANTTRTLYESFLKRASETGEEEKLTSKNIRVIAVAEPPVQPTGLSRKIIAIGGLLAGFAAGVGIGILVGVIRSLKAGTMLERRRPVPTGEVAPRVMTGQSPRTAPSSARPVPAGHIVSEDAMEDDGNVAPAREPRKPSSHHVLASAAALSALSPAKPQRSTSAIRSSIGRQAVKPASSVPQEDPAIAKVRSDLRALRSRVERYNRAHGAGER